jgi:hypothetical protein
MNFFVYLSKISLNLLFFTCLLAIAKFSNAQNLPKAPFKNSESDIYFSKSVKCSGTFLALSEQAAKLGTKSDVFDINYGAFLNISIYIVLSNGFQGKVFSPTEAKQFIPIALTQEVTRVRDTLNRATDRNGKITEPRLWASVADITADCNRFTESQAYRIYADYVLRNKSVFERLLN